MKHTLNQIALQLSFIAVGFTHAVSCQRPRVSAVFDIYMTFEASTEMISTVFEDAFG